MNVAYSSLCLLLSQAQDIVHHGLITPAKLNCLSGSEISQDDLDATDGTSEWVIYVP